MATICVNRSGKSWKVTKTNGGTDYIGTSKSNQVFVWTRSIPKKLYYKAQ
jgi:hypothetical protein